jgi:predicted transcriptional regulator
MEEKGLVKHRQEGRTFIYRPVYPRQQTASQLAAQLLERAFGGAVDQLVQSVLEARRPTRQELEKLEELIAQAKAAQKKPGKK